MLAIVAALILAMVPAAQARSRVYRAQLDAMPPKGESWSFLRFFPRSITVHRGDVIDAAWGGAEAPHTATLVPSAKANAWRRSNQGSGDPYQAEVPDSAVGGDDSEVVFNPAVVSPSDPTCGQSSTSACSFDGSSVVSSGLRFGNPSNEPSFFVKLSAPVGTYTFLCLIHPGMQLTVHVAPRSQPVPSPAAVTRRTQAQVHHAIAVDAPVADAQAQHVVSGPVEGGHRSFTMSAGGFYHQVSADEFPDQGVTMHVGDTLQITGNFEIHTATIPSSSAATTPFVLTQCEVPGADTPAASPADCASPTDFQVALNPQAAAPTASLDLTDPSTFVNSGVMAAPSSTVFTAAAPGVYTVICLVHGPSMSTTITVKG